MWPCRSPQFVLPRSPTLLPCFEAALKLLGAPTVRAYARRTNKTP